MVKRNSVPMRIDGELADMIREIKKEEGLNLSDAQASRKIKKMLEELKRRQNDIQKKIKF